MAVIEADNPTIESRTALVEYFSKGEKPRETWRIGTEHEKFCLLYTSDAADE